MTGVCPAGFPHSEISGSKPACGYPELIAAYHVLHRLLVPRHPPYALSSLTIIFQSGHQADHPAARMQPDDQPKTNRKRRLDRLSATSLIAIRLSKSSSKPQSVFVTRERWKSGLPTSNVLRTRALLLVEVSGLEPLTFWLQTRRSPN